MQSDVNGGFSEWMPVADSRFQRLIHLIVDFVEMQRILSEEKRRNVVLNR